MGLKIVINKSSSLSVNLNYWFPVLDFEVCSDFDYTVTDRPITQKVDKIFPILVVKFGFVLLH